MRAGGISLRRFGRRRGRRRPHRRRASTRRTIGAPDRGAPDCRPARMRHRQSRCCPPPTPARPEDPHHVARRPADRALAGQPLGSIFVALTSRPLLPAPPGPPPPPPPPSHSPPLP